MLKKKETYTKLEFTYQPDASDEEQSTEYTVVFEMKGTDESIQIIPDTKTEIETFKLPFHMLSEIVRNIEQWKRGPDVAARPIRPKSPVITDYREESSVPESIPEVGSPAAIQREVDESMEKLDTSQDDLVSLVSRSVPDSAQLGIDGDDENPIGLSIDDIARMGPVPETPLEFQHQLQKIGRKTPTRSKE